MTTINQELQNLDQTSGLCELHILDCTNLGGSIYRFSPNCYADGTQIVWQGYPYIHIPIQSSGWDLTSGGTQPQPQISISNVSRILLQAVVNLGDIAGATYLRYRTFAKYLDGEIEADATQYIGPDSYIIGKKVVHNKNIITFQLASIIDLPGRKIPARQVLKDKGFPGVSIYRNR